MNKYSCCGQLIIADSWSLLKKNFHIFLYIFLAYVLMSLSDNLCPQSILYCLHCRSCWQAEAGIKEFFQQMLAGYCKNNKVTAL